MSILDTVRNRPAGEAIEVVGKVSARLGVEVWLVGGAVRDSMLGIDTTDLDFAVSSGSDELCRKVAERLSGRITTHPRFLTASLRTPELLIDFTQTRSERYPTPGALPVVEPASLAEDLARRDFTVNSMAVGVGDGSELIDPHSGEEDVKKGVIRVLHPASFRDDPTRIDRAVRFAHRLEFTIEEATREQMIELIRNGGRHTVSLNRLLQELLLVLQEVNGGHALFELSQIGALAPLGIDPLTRSRSDAAVVLAAVEVPGLDGEAAALGVILSPSRVEDVATALQISAPRIRSIEQVAEAIEKHDPPTSDLEMPEVEVAKRIVRGIPADDYLQVLDRHRGTSLPFRGNEVHSEPGPHLSRAIRETRHALAWEEIEEKQALEFARRLALRYLNDE